MQSQNQNQIIKIPIRNTALFSTNVSREGWKNKSVETLAVCNN